MLYGFYTAASGMLNQERTLNVLGNNITNSQTPGYKAGRLVKTSFTQELMSRIDEDGKTSIGKASPIQLVEEIDTLFDPAQIEETNRPFDMAIEGYGFFGIKDTEGNSYLTRNGNFYRDAEGYLTLSGVGRVQGEDGEIEIPSANFTVLTDGSVLDENGDEISKILVYSPQTDNILKHTNGTYTLKEGNIEDNMAQEDSFNHLERSNINVNNEVARLMEAQRAFQSCSQVVKTMDQINQKTVTQIAAL
ncbi:MAG: flagellar hook-basal body protein [Oscillospiraceae bacterium]